MKLPAFQFYPGDWLKDANLRRCSHAAKGVWIDMLCLMFECDTRGVLASNGQPWSDTDIVAAVGGDAAEVRSCITELLSKGVASRNGEGAIFSRRLVRDEQIRQERVRAGSKGGSKTQANKQATRQQTSEDEVEDEERIRKGDRGKPASDANIPTLAEIKRYGSIHAVPDRICESFFDWYQGNNLWLNQHGRLIDWKYKLPRWREGEKVWKGTPTALSKDELRAKLNRLQREVLYLAGDEKEAHKNEIAATASQLQSYNDTRTERQTSRAQ